MIGLETSLLLTQDSYKTFHASRLRKSQVPCRLPSINSRCSLAAKVRDSRVLCFACTRLYFATYSTLATDSCIVIQNLTIRSAGRKSGSECSLRGPLWFEPGRRRDTAEQSLSCRSCKFRARLLAATLPLQHTERIVCEVVDVETCMQRIEATPHDDDIRGRHDDRVLATAAFHGERS